MTQILLPADFPVHVDQPVTLVARQGLLTPAQAPRFPNAYAKSEDILALLPPAKEGQKRLEHLYGDGRLPVMPTADGLVFDTDWAPFGIFQLHANNLQHVNMFEGIRRNEIAWDIKCPAMANYTSLMGQLIAHYGKHSGGDPERPGIDDLGTLRRHRLDALLEWCEPKALAEFEDEGRTLLDMACTQQQWRLAGFLWDRGVRWSAKALEQGLPLEALVVATIQLQGNLRTIANDDLDTAVDGPTRVAWLERWLGRYESMDGPIMPAPALTWRARLAQVRNWDAGKSILDTPASFWITHFSTQLPGAGGLLRHDLAAPHHRDLVDTWVRFWGRHGVDLEQVPVRRGEKERMGFSGYWAGNKGLDGWLGRIRALALEMRLSTQTAPAKNQARGPRL